MASGLLSVKFVATDGLVWQGDAVSVLVRTVEGDIGILVGHEPLMAALVPHGAEAVTPDGVRHVIAIDSGFISVFNDHVSVLSAYGELADEISLDEAQIELAAMHSKVQSAEVTERELRQYRRLQSQVKAGEKYRELAKNTH
ncbi:F0F1 ATP synthase subunit epsilon [Propionimicrobium sp. PCR01-08-3]|uniref:F0F1 ATP synthase subunit epsilon n=1 Tax=Propionimicrobium sp. PCR01-08-3 TaxID=3052086 RepID=UPI00255C84B4|nr:F0F1 ATP synthase subunit epsilon [Propionimicrobium sp. PCR01-08-3]WIY83823.1 F0F1 ATP synthase subunit epsilon [Propionimicrobium sp. PCR01-08-3]